MHRRKAECHSGDTGERTRGYGHQPEQQCAQGAYANRSKSEMRRARLSPERRTTSPSISAREATANTGGPLRRSCKSGALLRGGRCARRRKRLAHLSAGCFLRIRIGARRRVCSDQERLRIRRGELHTALARARRALGPDGIQDREQLPGRIVREQGFQQRTFGGGECLEGADDGLVQSRDREVRRRYCPHLPGDSGVGIEKARIALERLRLPVTDAREGGIRGAVRAQAPSRRAPPRAGVRATGWPRG